MEFKERQLYLLDTALETLQHLADNVPQKEEYKVGS